MDLTPDHKLSAYVTIDRQVVNGKVERVATFPQILKSTGFYVGIVHDGVEIKAPRVAFLIDLIKWGYENLEDYYTLSRPREPDDDLGLPDVTSLPYEERWALNLSRPLSSWFKRVEVQEPTLPGKRRTKPKYVMSRTRFHSPTLCVGPRGYREAMATRWGEGKGTAADAALLSCIQIGIQIRNYDNKIPNIHIDDSAERLAFLRGRMSAPDFVAVAQDSGWEHDSRTSIARRGINDYNREVTFARSPTEKELEIFKEMLALDNCPGYTGIASRALSPAQYIFRTTCDSSD